MSTKTVEVDRQNQAHVIWKSMLNAELSTLYYQRRAASAAKESKIARGLSLLLSSSASLAFVATLGLSEWIVNIFAASFAFGVVAINVCSIFLNTDNKLKDFAHAHGNWAEQKTEWQLLWQRLLDWEEIDRKTIEELRMKEGKLDHILSQHDEDQRLKIECQLEIQEQHGLQSKDGFRKRAKKHGIDIIHEEDRKVSR